MAHTEVVKNGSTVQPFVARNPVDLYFPQKVIGKVYTWIHDNEKGSVSIAKIAAYSFGCVAQLLPFIDVGSFAGTTLFEKQVDVLFHNERAICVVPATVTALQQYLNQKWGIGLVTGGGLVAVALIAVALFQREWANQARDATAKQSQIMKNIQASVTLSEKIEGLEKALKEKEKELQQVDGERGELDINNSTLTEDLRVAEGNLEKKDREIEKLAKEKQQLGTAFDEKFEELAAKTEKERNENRIKWQEFIKQQKQKEQEIEKLKKELETAKQNEAIAKQKVQELENTEFAQENQKLQKEIDGVKDASTQLFTMQQEELRKLGDELQEKNKEIKTLEQELESAKEAQPVLEDK